MAAKLLFIALFILQAKYSFQRTSTCGNIQCVVAAVGCKDKNGTQVCNCFVGVSGDACEIDRDECTRSPCGHRGSCVNSFGSYTCDCLRGWEGMTCRSRTSTEPDFDCFPGWEGKFCMYDIDECTNGSPPCTGPNQQCVNTDGSYNCTCNAGWEGIDCLQDIDECANSSANSPCGEKHMCQNTPGSFGCPCLSGWYGLNCSQNINECITEPCGSSGTCIDNEGSFVCKCLPGLTGDRCEVNSSDLPLSPTTSAIIGSVAGLALIFLICAIVFYLCMRFKLKKLRDQQEEERRRHRIHDRTSKIRPAGPMFSVNRSIDDSLDNKWSTTTRHAQYKQQTNNGRVLRSSPNQAIPEYRTRAVQPYDGNMDYSRPSRNYKSPSEMYRSRMARDSTRQQTTHQPDPYETEEHHSDRKWDNNRSTRNYNSSADTVESRMSSVSSRPPTIPINYYMDPVFGN